MTSCDFINRKKVLRFLMLFLFIFSISVISFFTGKSGNESYATSDKLARIIENFVGSHFYIDPSDVFWNITLNNILRKLAHLFEFAFLGVTAFGFFILIMPKKSISLIFSVSFCSLFALVDEVRQMFSDGRGPSWFDVKLDILGSILGIIFMGILYLIYSKYNRLKSRVMEVESEKKTEKI